MHLDFVFHRDVFYLLLALAFLKENTTFQTVALLLFKNLICVRQPGFPITF